MRSDRMPREILCVGGSTKQEDPSGTRTSPNGKRRCIGGYGTTGVLCLVAFCEARPRVWVQLSICPPTSSHVINPYKKITSPSSVPLFPSWSSQIRGASFCPLRRPLCSISDEGTAIEVCFFFEIRDSPWSKFHLDFD